MAFPMPARALCLGLYLIAAVLAAITSLRFAAFTADDAYIVARYAVNARDAGEWAFNPGEPVSALTSPLQACCWLPSLFASDPLPLTRRSPIVGRVIHPAAVGLGAALRGDALAALLVALRATPVDLRGLETPLLRPRGYGCTYRCTMQRGSSLAAALRPCGADALRRSALAGPVMLAALARPGRRSA
jgi:hypothetical protein